MMICDTSETQASCQMGGQTTDENHPTITLWKIPRYRNTFHAVKDSAALEVFTLLSGIQATLKRSFQSDINDLMI